MRYGWITRLLVAALLLVVASSWAVADTQPSREEAANAAWETASKAMQHGPQTIALGDQAKLTLPEGYGFVPVNEAATLMQVMGNSTDDSFLGLIFPLHDAPWFVSLRFDAAGYIKDDDAKNWNADDLLKTLREGTEEGNKHREQMGVPAITVSRWIESPQYDAENHRLVWSAEARLKNGDDPDPGVNYNTYLLGREGYISLNLITGASHIVTDKSAAHELLAAVNFDAGKRYTDFNSSTDKVAAYGLAALIGGVALKKLGMLAVIGAFVLKFAKLFAIGAAAIGGGFLKFFRRKSDGASNT
jgi:uncharacterized membrane-anchored protein